MKIEHSFMDFVHDIKVTQLLTYVRIVLRSSKLECEAQNLNTKVFYVMALCHRDPPFLLASVNFIFTTAISQGVFWQFTPREFTCGEVITWGMGMCYSPISLCT
jgi:hypothetical protein